jgi:DNA-binding beta-propeller fold protein YncE
MKNSPYNFSFLLLITLWFLSSCSATKNVAEKSYVVYPPAPDTARIQYLTSISSSDNTTIRKSGFNKFVMGEEESKQIKKPYGVAIKDGKIYVCDSGLGGLEIIDLEKKTFELFLPDGAGQLRLPLNCFVDDDGNLFIADGERQQVVVFNHHGSYVTSFGEKENFRPTDVFVYDDKVWVSNVLDNHVYVYQNGNFNLLYKLPEAEKGTPGYLYQPTNLFVTPELVYVSDMGDFNIKTYTHDGQFVKSIGSHGTGTGQFVRPKGIAVDKEMKLYVVDAGFENTQIFDKDGKLLLFFGGPYKGPGDLWLPAKVVIDYDNLKYFEDFVEPGYELKYLVLVTSQFGPDKLNIYGAVQIK